MSETAFAHAPVMMEEAVHAISPRDRGLYVDGTFGAGGYTRALLSAADCKVIGFDRDPTARAMGEDLKRASGGRFVLVEARFADMEAVVKAAGGETVDGVVLDIGVSSMQLDDARRGFSFQADGPLDMRMGREGPTAADAVAELSQDDLRAIFRVYGEEKKAGRAAAAIVKARNETPITTTGALAAIVEKAVGKGEARIHPATRVFQALRLYVNDELAELADGLAAAERLLAPGGRLAVVTFHSLEDRIVKTFLKRRAGLEPGVSRHAPAVADGPEPSFRLLFTGHRAPSDDEVAANRRARSAKLRAGVRTDAEAWEDRGDLVPSAPRVVNLARSAR